MIKIEVTGASDDLVEIDGDIREEFNYKSSESNLLAFSDGTVLSITYSKEGMWRIAPLVRGSAGYELVQATDPEDVYSDKATLTGDIKWVVFGTGWAS